ncbi:MAG: dockerin type I repeat-containing protein [Muribaculaceae bacterium]|nr:dockerin type I repeat-containing protein [Muribaculaceae bacterium]
MKKLFTLIVVAAMAFAAQAAECIAADGTNTGEYAPVYGYNNDYDQHNQMQYPAAELPGMAAGSEITAVKFYTSTPDLVNALGSTVTVSLANIDDVTPWTPDAWGGISGNLLDAAVTAVATVTPAADEDGVWTITFDAPFTYTGNALLIDVQTVAGEYKSTYFYGKEMGSYLVMSTYGYAGSKKGQTVLPKATFIYEGGEVPEPGIATLAEANALEDAAEFTFDGDAVVTVFKNGYLFLRDESGYGMIAGATGEFANGQVLNQGWNATKTSDDGWVWYTGATELSASGETNAELAAAQKLTEFPDESMLNAYVYVENVTISGGMMPGLPMRALPLPDNSSISVTSTLWSMGWPASGSKNIYGVICKVDGVLKINVVDFQNYVEPEPEGMRGDVNKSGDVTIADVTALIDYLLSGDATNISLDNANCNLDDDVTIADVTVLIDYLLTGNW